MMKEEITIEFGADAAEKQTSEKKAEVKQVEADLDDTRNEQAEEEEIPDKMSPKKDR